MNQNFYSNIILSFLLITFSVSVFAQKQGRWHGGNIHHFEHYDRRAWLGGGWHHVRYGGRLGWWWVVGPSWYYYSRPIYPYPDPYIPPIVLESTTNKSPPSSPIVQNWYYCEESKEYYPYVSTCPSGWKTVPATPSIELTR